MQVTTEFLDLGIPVEAGRHRITSGEHKYKTIEFTDADVERLVECDRHAKLILQPHANAPMTVLQIDCISD